MNSMRISTCASVLLALFAACTCFAEPPAEKSSKPNQKATGKQRATGQSELAADRIETYKTIDGVELKAFQFLPSGHQASDKRPAIVFFFGGGWTNGSPGQFVEQCKYLASRGMVAITCDYRVASRHGVKAIACVRDAKSAIRWVRANAARLGVDPERIVAAGGSAGGHIAACTGIIEGLDEPSEDAAISSQPNALALFNPALVLADIEGANSKEQLKIENLRNRLGVEPATISPVHHVDPKEPITVIFHGKADVTVPYRTAEQFTEAMKASGNDCQLIGYEGQGHGFFNFGRGDVSGYQSTLAELDSFLVRIGYLAQKP